VWQRSASVNRLGQAELHRPLYGGAKLR